MLTRFKVVREPFGWAVRVDGGMVSPFRSRSLALRHAQFCADTLRRHGEQAQVVLEDGTDGQPDEIRVH